MFDVDKLKEALEWFTPERRLMLPSDVGYRLDKLLRAFGLVVVAGQPFSRCDAHDARRITNEMCDVMAWSLDMDTEPEPEPCRMVEGWWMPTGKDET